MMSAKKISWADDVENKLPAIPWLTRSATPTPPWITRQVAFIQNPLYAPDESWETFDKVENGVLEAIWQEKIQDAVDKQLRLDDSWTVVQGKNRKAK